MSTVTKSGLQVAVENALTKGTEKERIIAVLDCVRGYKNEYNHEEQNLQSEGFMKCKNEYRHQLDKIKNIVLGSNI